MQALRSFQELSNSLPIAVMKTIAEIRLDNLLLLIEEVGSAEALASKVNSSAVYISQLKNRAPDSKTKKPRQIGDPLARKMESACGKERGWMDHEHPLLTHRQKRIEHAHLVMESMSDYELDRAVKIIDTIAQPDPRQGNGAP
jgi:hypothetical protein